MAKRDSDGIYKRRDRGKESKHWWVTYTDTIGKRVRQSTGTDNYKEAQALLAKWRLEAHRTERWGEAPVRTFDELMLKYIRATEKHKKDPGRDKISLKHLYPAFSGKDINRLTTADIRTYIAQRKEAGAAASTINKEVGMFSSAINFAKREWDWHIQNPCSGCKQKEPEGIVRWITRAEAVALIEAAKHDYRAASHLPEFITLALHTGCRRGELLSLEWNRVNMQERLLLLEAIHTKAGRRRSVPLNATAYEAIRRRARFRAENCPDSRWVFFDIHLSLKEEDSLVRPPMPERGASEKHLTSTLPPLALDRRRYAATAYPTEEIIQASAISNNGTALHPLPIGRGFGRENGNRAGARIQDIKGGFQTACRRAGIEEF